MVDASDLASGRGEARSLRREGAPRFFAMGPMPVPTKTGLAREHVAMDALCRMRAMQGYDVLQAVVFDDFGAATEAAARGVGVHSADLAEREAERFWKAADDLGLALERDRAFSTADPRAYRWAQWTFEVLVRQGLAYQGPDERWRLRLSALGDRLVDDLEDLDWPEAVKESQRALVGRVEGVEFEMRIEGTGDPEPERLDLDAEALPSPAPLTVRAFTERIETLFGAAFVALSPDHPLVPSLPVEAGDPAAGVFAGVYALNPANGARLPIWIADHPGPTGARLGVPAHVDWDCGFALAHGLDRPLALAPFEGLQSAGELFDLPFVGEDAVLVNSGEYDGLTVPEARASLGRWIEGVGIGERTRRFHVPDAVVSAPRAWGCPLPVIHAKDGERQLVPERDLPVYLPFLGTGDPDFGNVTDLDGRLGRRETDVLDGPLASAWAFLRAVDPHNDEAAWSREAADHWLPIDRAVVDGESLLLVRFLTKALYDAGLVGVQEPFAGVSLPSGLRGSAPLSTARSAGATPSPEQSGAEPRSPNEWDSERLAFFSGEDALECVLRAFEALQDHHAPEWRDLIDFEEEDAALRGATRAAIHAIGRAIERLDPVAGAARLAEYAQAIIVPGDEADRARVLALSEAAETLALLLAPFAPRSADGLWSRLGREGFTLDAAWPTAKPMENDVAA